ncbi:hypothetical protein [Streptomyces sp. CA-111067]|uniref:hypothetical protein n=1 Tax=Streptomyces sp. CA-111067 TaxID=3240046 RepID=UPI003D960819
MVDGGTPDGPGPGAAAPGSPVVDGGTPDSSGLGADSPAADGQTPDGPGPGAAAPGSPVVDGGTPDDCGLGAGSPAADGQTPDSPGSGSRGATPLAPGLDGLVRDAEVVAGELAGDLTAAGLDGGSGTGWLDRASLLRRIAAGLAAEVPATADRLVAVGPGAQALGAAVSLETGLPFAAFTPGAPDLGVIHPGETVVVLAVDAAMAAAALPVVRAAGALSHTAAVIVADVPGRPAAVPTPLAGTEPDASSRAQRDESQPSSGSLPAPRQPPTAPGPVGGVVPAEPPAPGRAQREGAAGAGQPAYVPTPTTPDRATRDQPQPGPGEAAFRRRSALVVRAAGRFVVAGVAPEPESTRQENVMSRAQAPLPRSASPGAPFADDPASVERAGAELAEAAGEFGAQAVVSWDDTREVLLAHVVARTLGVPRRVVVADLGRLVVEDVLPGERTVVISLGGEPAPDLTPLIRTVTGHGGEVVAVCSLTAPPVAIGGAASGAEA